MPYHYHPEECHWPLLDTAPKRLAFDASQDGDLAAWQTQLRQTLHTLLAMPSRNAPLDIRIQQRLTHQTYDEIQFVFTAEANAHVPAHLLIPHGVTQPPVVIALQGHTSGMHISLGQAIYPGDAEALAGERDYAIQAIGQGYAALVIEQRAMGRRSDQRDSTYRHGVDRPCHHTTLSALLLGRTLLGERVFDVTRAIDAIAHFDQVDATRIAVVGDSTGGTIAFFSACVDQRIRMAIPAAYVCSARFSLGRHDHCEDHYLPGMLNYFDIGDLAGLIAPRHLVVVAGHTDVAFPIDGVHDAYTTIQRIYAATGHADACQLVIGDGGHRFFAHPTWEIVRTLTQW